MHSQLIYIFLNMMILVIGTAAFGQSKEPKKESTISFCDIAKEPKKYLNQSVRVRVIYRVGFEWQEIYSLHCIDAPETWLEFSPNFERGSSPEQLRQMDVGKNFSITVGVVLEGRLTGAEGRYGHLNGYLLEFTAERVERAIRLDNKGYHRNSLDAEDRKRIMQFENSKNAQH